MQKSYKKYVLIVLSTISASLAGMDQSNDTIWFVRPKGGYVVAPDNANHKSIHFEPTSGNEKSTIYEFLKYGARPALPLELFTKTGKSYTFSSEAGEFTIMSDRVYNETEFVTYNEYWKNIHNKNQ